MKILLHICCAPCSVYPLKILEVKFKKIVGYFYRYNIHPYKECVKRENSLRAYTKLLSLQMIYQNDYKIENFIQNVVFREQDRCLYCYHDRINTVACIAKKSKFDFFSTTLLYSKFQNHKLIKSISESVSKRVGIPFYYCDFRIGWEQGIQESRVLGMYRQSYCGCIYSEKEKNFKTDKLCV